MSELWQQLLDPGNLLTNMVGGLGIHIIFYGMLSLVLPPRSKKVYWGVLLPLVMVLLFLKPVIPFSFRSVLYPVLAIFLPALFLRGSLFVRLLIGTFASFALAAGELAGAALWVSLTGLGVVSNDVLFEHLPAYLLGMLGGDAVVTSLLLLGLRVLVRRFVPKRLLDDRTPSVADRWTRPYVCFVVAQLLLILEAMGVGFAVERWSWESVAVVGGLFAAFTVVDVLLFFQIGRSVRWFQSQARAQVLEQQISDYLESSERVQVLLGDTARLRHDLRNHRMVVEALCERGDYDRAQAYLEEMSRGLAIERTA